jgi:hypothetical protein
VTAILFERSITIGQRVEIAGAVGRVHEIAAARPRSGDARRREGAG